jgi:hypothetical protein
MPSSCIRLTAVKYNKIKYPNDMVYLGTDIGKRCEFFCYYCTDLEC